MKKLIAIALALTSIFLLTISALAQGEGELLLNLSRDFGYSSGTGRIQGRFSMRVSGPEDLQRVVFLIDNQRIGEDLEAPFSLQFSTSDFRLGVHTISATGYTRDGSELHSNEYRREFVSSDEGMKSAFKIVLPIIGVTFSVILLSFLLPVIGGRGKRSVVPLGAPRSYGLVGGTICPKCSRPFGMHFWGLNLLTRKLDRCPHCGRWSMVQRASLEALKAAEAAELERAAASQAQTPPTSEETLQRELDESRYLDL